MPYVLYEKKGRVVCITLNRPERFVVAHEWGAY
jgi:hypothetical protein